jgi:hypothetical protein
MPGAGMQQMVTFQPATSASCPAIYQLHVTAIGNKTASSGTFCYILTLITAVLLIIPLFFMSCKWWQKLIYPKYEVNPELYHSVVRFIRRQESCVSLSLKVCDNGFDASKARILAEGLQGTRVVTFAFVNMAGLFNYAGSEADDFQENAAMIKQLPITVIMMWGTLRG